jgi:SAM-dependent methyltransferase
MHWFLKQLPQAEGFTFEHEGRIYNRPYHTITVGGVEIPGLRSINTRQDIIEPFLTNGKCLEIGSNLGEMSRWLSMRYSVTAIESDPIYIKLATYLNKGYNINLFHASVVGNSLDMLFPPESFDTIFVMSVIEYIQNKPLFLKSLARLLKSNGILFLEGHPLDIRDGRYIVYEDLLKNEFAIERLKNTDPGINTKESEGRPLWICRKSQMNAESLSSLPQ